MPDTAAPLAAWDSFYVVVGSSAAALTGLQFVVITLIADARRRGGPAEVAAFGSPTVVHFCAALLMSALLSAPWPSLRGVHIALLIVGIAGVCYILLVLRRARRQRGYQPVLEDWLWHTVLPLVAYAGVLAGAAMMGHGIAVALFAIAGASLLLLFIGIHNAWDTVIFVAIEQPAHSPAERTPAETPPAPRA